jgi:hypothetical protein
LGITYHRDMLSMIRAGYLCDLRGVQIRLKVELDRVHSRGGDFVESELAAEMERADTPRHIRRLRSRAGARSGQFASLTKRPPRP